MKGWISKPSHHNNVLYRFSLDYQRFFGVKACSLQPFTVALPCVKALISKPSHLKPLKISKKRAPCEGVNTFFGNLNAYIRARVEPFT